MKAFYNTTRESGQLLVDFEHKSEFQDQKIYNFFKENMYCGYTPESVHENVFDNKTPITSVRRGITTLQKQGKLVKFECVKSTGSYGRPVSVWCYNEKHKDI